MMYLPSEGEVVEVGWRPNRGAQTTFLSSWAREVLYGGAVSGGKTDALVMGNLGLVSHPKHRSITFRRERDDVQEIVDRMRDIYPVICPKAIWVESRNRWEWPSGAFSFVGSAQRTNDIEAYKSFEFDRICFDELTTFERHQYIYMLSRNRSKSEDLPLHIRSGTNPDGPGHGWVFNRFIKGRKPYTIYRTLSNLPSFENAPPMRVELTQQYIPATVFDNPMVSNREEYIAGLMAMGTQLAEALLYGKWDYFRGQMFPYGKLGGLVEVERGLKQLEHYTVRGLDYGWTDPTVVYWVVVYPNRDGGAPDIEVVDELAVTETNVQDIVHYIRKREQDLALQGVRAPSMSVIDPATKGTHPDGRSTLNLFEENGCWFTLATNDRQAGWGRLRQLLEQGRVGVWKDAAPYLCHTIPKLVRDPGKADDLLGKKQNDHGADTLRYIAMEIRDGAFIRQEERKQVIEGTRDMGFEKMIKQLHRGQESTSFDDFGEGY